MILTKRKWVQVGIGAVVVVLLWVVHQPQRHHYSYGTSNPGKTRQDVITPLYESVKSENGPIVVDTGISHAVFSGDLDEERYFDEFKMAARDSVFSYLRDSTLRSIMGKDHGRFKKWVSGRSRLAYIVSNWESATLSDQCKVLVSAMYKKDPNWNHMDLTQEYTNRGDSSPNLIKAIERLRIYDTCFIIGGVGNEKFFEEIREELGSPHVTAEDFQARMLPFLRQMPPETTEHMLPRVVNTITGKLDPNWEVLVPPYEFNANFLYHWRRMAHGRGIVTTVAPHQIPLLKQQFVVWQQLNNTLPIQITYKNKELNDAHRNEITKIAEETGQAVYLINMQPILDDDYSKHHIKGSANKFLATFFNTFEEFIFVDADTVSFVNPMEYFEMRSYKKSGMRFWRDRRLYHLGHDEYCSDIIIDLIPTFEEHLYLGSNWDLLPTDPEVKTSTDPKAFLFSEYFHRNLLHHVESGLFVVNKSQKLAGLVAALFLDAHWGFRGCSNGDRESFWLGPMVMGMDFYVDKSSAAALGKIHDVKTPDGKPAKAICSTQLAHVDDDLKLLWAKGGLRTCKFDDAAKQDMDNNEEYFTSKFENINKLEAHYRSELNVEGYIIPDVDDIAWQASNECKGRVNCALVRLNDKIHNSHLGVLSPDERQRISHLVNMYNKAV